MNVENIKKVRDHIAALPPERFDLSCWFYREGANYYGWNAAEFASFTNRTALEGSCGTAACIAGHTLAALTPDEAVPARPGKAAAALLGLGPLQADLLFEPLSNLWGDLDGLPAGRQRRDVTRDEALRVIDHFIKTGLIDWGIIGPQATKRTKAHAKIALEAS